MCGDGSIGAMKGYVLAGGASRRMGADKRMSEISGETMLARVVATVRAATGIESVTIVTKDSGTVHDVRVIFDSRSGRGALSGIEAALQDAGTDAQALIVACDYPLLRPETLAGLIACGAAEPGRVVMPRMNARLHPLVAVWPVVSLEPLRAQIERDDWRVTALAEGIGIIAVEASGLGAAAEEFENVNAPSDLSRVRRIDAGRFQSSR